jgi:hypothetical protein
MTCQESDGAHRTGYQPKPLPPLIVGGNLRHLSSVPGMVITFFGFDNQKTNASNNSPLSFHNHTFLDDGEQTKIISSNRGEHEISIEQSQSIYVPQVSDIKL